MDVDGLRARNQRKAQREAERSPVRGEPGAVPIGEAIEAFHARDALVFGIPAHRAGRGDVVPDAVRWTGIEAFRSDIGMDKGVDTRHQSWQVEPTAMQLFAEAVGADQTLFSTNGSSQNVHVALLATVAPGETVVMARNGHKSAFAGLVLSGARPVYVDPVYDGRWQVAHGVDPAELRRALDAHPEARAVLLSGCAGPSRSSPAWNSWAGSTAAVSSGGRGWPRSTPPTSPSTWPGSASPASPPPTGCASTTTSAWSSPTTAASWPWSASATPTPRSTASSRR